MTGQDFAPFGGGPGGFSPDQMRMMQQWQMMQQQQTAPTGMPSGMPEPPQPQAQFQQLQQLQMLKQHSPSWQQSSAPPMHSQEGFGGSGSATMPGSSGGSLNSMLNAGMRAPSPEAPPPSMPRGPPGGGGFPSMADLGKNTSVGGSSSTLQEHEIKVTDPYGRPVAQIPRYATFEETPFPPSIKDALMRAGFPSPSQIQQYTWPLSMQLRDVIGVAATGSGKTLAFLLPAFTYIIENRIPPGDPVLLVIAPTRELAVQIQDESKKFGSSSSIHTTCCYGGAPKPPQADEIRRGVNGIIGTPGRINDFLEGGQLRLNRVAKLVLDEADRMLDMGFEPQIRKILAQVPTQRHTLFFTATWPPNVRRLASEFLREAYQVQIGNRDELKGNQDITQIVKICQGHEKNRVLMDVLREAQVADRNNSLAKGIVFCSTKRMCDQLAQQLNRQGVPCDAIHGDKKQHDRERALGDLKDARIKLLVATDVAARGLDIKGVTLVVNYDPPSNTEDYVHRIGRTGRAGQKGYAVALVADRDAHALRGIIQVMKRTNQTVTEDVERMAANAGPPPPSGRALRKGGGKGDFGRPPPSIKGGGGFGAPMGGSYGGGMGGGYSGGGSFGGGMGGGGYGGGAPPPPMGGGMGGGGYGGGADYGASSYGMSAGGGSAPSDAPSRRSPSGRRARRRSPSRRGRSSPSVRRGRDRDDDRGRDRGRRRSRSRSRDRKRRRRRSSSSS